MKKCLSAALAAALCLVIFCGFQVWIGQAQAAPGDEKITVLTPLGHPPNIKLKKMAPRLDTLEGKTIYFVDDGFIGGDNLLYEMIDWFKANYPKTNVLYKRKGGI